MLMLIPSWFHTIVIRLVVGGRWGGGGGEGEPWNKEKKRKGEREIVRWGRCSIYDIILCELHSRELR